MFKISKEERKIQFIYLLVLWTCISLLFCFVCFFNYPKITVRSQEIVIERISNENSILKSQLETEVTIDSLNRMLPNFDPETSPPSTESNIRYEIDAIKYIVDAKKKDEHYQIFRQFHQLTNIQYFDKKEIRISKNNYTDMENALKNCNDKLDRLNLKDAFSPQAPQAN